MRYLSALVISDLNDHQRVVVIDSYPPSWYYANSHLVNSNLKIQKTVILWSIVPALPNWCNTIVLSLLIFQSQCLFSSHKLVSLLHFLVFWLIPITMLCECYLLCLVHLSTFCLPTCTLAPQLIFLWSLITWFIYIKYVLYIIHKMCILLIVWYLYMCKHTYILIKISFVV